MATSPVATAAAPATTTTHGAVQASLDATSDAPAFPVGEFRAALCPGTTDHDPRWSGPDHHPDLTLVSGQRLEAYNAGQLVPLYDVDGTSDADSHPPLCTVRYDAAADGPVSEWSFCTDAHLNTCNNLLPGGVLAEGDVPVPFPTLARPHRLNGEQLAAVDAMIRDGYTSPLGHTGRADGTVAERHMLQSMIWCVTDGIYCDIVGLDEDEIARLASEGRAWVDVEASEPTVEVGQKVSWTVRTNVPETPLAITSDAEVRVCDESAGHAVLGPDGTLVIEDDAPTFPAEVRLCADAVEDEGSIMLSASGGGDGTSYHQSDVTGTGLDKGCQTYALWEQARFEDRAVVTVSSAPSDPTVPPTEAPTDPTDPPTDPTDRPTDPTDPPTDVPTDPPTGPTTGGASGSGSSTPDSSSTPDATPGSTSTATSDSSMKEATREASGTTSPTSSEESRSGLAATGTWLGPVVAAGAALVVVGTGVLIVRRRRSDAA